MTLDFLTPAPDVLAHSPMERCARAAGARFAARDGWLVAVGYDRPPSDTGWADMSHLTKLEPDGRRRSLVVAQPAEAAEIRERLGARAVDVTTAYAALAVVGPGAREVLARLTALDLRPSTTPVDALKPGAVARTPALVLREADERYLVLFGAALGEYMWTVLADAAAHVGGAPIGADALAREAGARA